MNALSEEVRVFRAKNAVAAGQTNQDSAVIDMTGFEAIRAVALMGALTNGHATKLQILQGSAANGSDATLIPGAEAAAADGDSNELLVVDVVRPRKRYVVVRFARGTENAVLDGVIVELYRARNMPTATHASVAAQAVVVGTTA